MKTITEMLVITGVLSLVLVVANAYAGTGSQADAAEPAPAATAVAAADHELTNASCGEYLDLIDRVKKEQAAPAGDAAAKSNAQDDLVNVMLWLHGYISGRSGIDNKARPLNREWLSTHVVKLAEICAVDERRRVVDVVSGVQ